MQYNIIDSYEEIDEENRLQSSLARRVEFISTTEAIEPYILPGMKVLDCGCGVGIYSIYLARRQASVTAIDLVPKHIKRLQELIMQDPNLLIDASVKNAVDLSQYKNEMFDMVLCLGPLYHLVSKEQQMQCLNECLRVTKTNGIIAIAYISPYSVLPCVARGGTTRISTELITKIIDDKKITSDDPCCFWTDNCYYTPEEIEVLVRNAGMEIVDHLASDGQSIAFQSVINSMDEQEYAIWLAYHRRVCREPSIIGTSNHGLLITRKKE